jgi:hypothetical protein
MLRLLLGLLIALALLYGGYRTLRRETDAAAPRTAIPSGETAAPRGPASARAAVTGYQKAEAANRAAIERTLNAAEGSR